MKSDDPGSGYTRAEEQMRLAEELISCSIAIDGAIDGTIES